MRRQVIQISFNAPMFETVGHNLIGLKEKGTED